MLPSGITDFKSLQEHIDSAAWLDPLFHVRSALARRQGLAQEAAEGAPRQARRADGGEGRLELSRLCRSRRGLGAGVLRRKPAPRGSKASCRSGRTGLTSRAAARTGSRSNARAARSSSSAATAARRSGASRSHRCCSARSTDGKLVYAGKVGTGFDAGDFKSLSRKFKPLERATSRLRRGARRRAQGRGVARAQARVRRSPTPSGPGTDGSDIRASRACARTSRRARCIASRPRTRRPAWPRRQARARRAANRPSTASPSPIPTGCYYPDIGLTKLDVARYYETVAPVHAALRGEAADQPGALPRRRSTRSVSSSATP